MSRAGRGDITVTDGVISRRYRQLGTFGSRDITGLGGGDVAAISPVRLVISP
jgi:hypothetical protein